MSEEVSTASGSPAPITGQGGGVGPISASGPRPPPRRIKLTDEQLETISRDDLVKNWRELDTYIDLIESQVPSAEAVLHLRECEERLKQQYLESVHREKILVRRLATKEQEMQEYVSQIAELKSDKAPGPAALRSALLDPAVNLLLQRLRQELIATKARLEETQNELSAWKFTPDSNTGKRLMAKCRLLHQENEELGRTISSGRLAKLEGDLALQKSFSEEVKKSQSELDEFLQDLDEDVEGMQSTIYYLQQELRKAKDENTVLLNENQMLKSTTADGDTSSQAAAANGDIKTEVMSPCKSEPLPDLEPESTFQGALKEEEAPSTAVTDSAIEPDESADHRVPSSPAAAAAANEHPPTPPAANQRGASPPAAAAEPGRRWADDSSDSGELILNIEAEPMEDNDEADTRASPKRKRSVDEGTSRDDAPATKKARRDSELSLHCSEDDELMMKEGVVCKSPVTKVSDDEDSDTPLSLVRRDSQ